jgi:hypothetical protein
MPCSALCDARQRFWYTAKPCFPVVFFASSVTLLISFNGILYFEKICFIRYKKRLRIKTPSDPIFFKPRTKRELCPPGCPFAAISCVCIDSNSHDITCCFTPTEFDFVSCAHIARTCIDSHSTLILFGTLGSCDTRSSPANILDLIFLLRHGQRLISCSKVTRSRRKLVFFFQPGYPFPLIS